MRRIKDKSWDWPSPYKEWPVVVVEPLPPYVSPFAPRSRRQTSGVQPSELSAILQVASEPALHISRWTRPIIPQAPRLSGSFPNVPIAPGEPPPSSKEPAWQQFAPQSGSKGLLATFAKILAGTHGVEEKVARERFNAEHGAWKRDRYHLEKAERSYTEAAANFERDVKEYARNRETLEQKLDNETEDHNASVKYLNAALARDETAFDALLTKAAAGETKSLEDLAVQACLAIPIPVEFPAKPKASFDATEKILLIDLEEPNLGDCDLHVRLKTKIRAVTDKELRASQETLTYSLSLRILHEIFATPEFSCVKMVGVNINLTHIDRRTGKQMNLLVASVVATREEFASIIISNVDPKLCFRSLKGVTTPSFDEISAVRPLLFFGDADHRIVAGRAVADNLSNDTNLAAMDWEDFEHIVRELFAKLFSSRAQAEVHVTRASRDYGVDALIFDPDPIHGGKFVIQAKRYVNTVDVAAVRDLFGTVQNEGANRGYLVTTSSFGPESHAFAKGKALTLIDGSHLLRLLKEYGYFFKIDLQEARKILGQRGPAGRGRAT